MIMDKGQTQIFMHDDELDISHKINSIELDNWINHLSYVKKELNNLTTFYNKQHQNKRLHNEEILKDFEMKTVDNDVILFSLMQYKNSREKLMECDSTACDMSFINEHESCRTVYMSHIEKYRALKDQFFSDIKNQVIV